MAGQLISFFIKSLIVDHCRNSRSRCCLRPRIGCLDGFTVPNYFANAVSNVALTCICHSYRRCPSNQLLIVSGKVTSSKHPAFASSYELFVSRLLEAMGNRPCSIMEEAHSCGPSSRSSHMSV